MKLSICKEDLVDYLVSQLVVFFPDRANEGRIRETVAGCISLALERLEFCFLKINSKYFQDRDGSLFNHLHSDHYAMFLYFLSNTLYRNSSDVTVSSKLFLLNKSLHGIDAFYEVELPAIFLFVHPLGTVLGRAEYADYFLVYQGCNIGSNGGIYPRFGKYVSVHPGSSILGKCSVGDNCAMAAGSLLLDRDLENNSLYMGRPGDYQIVARKNKPGIWL